jgi:hypothetical protein
LFSAVPIGTSGLVIRQCGIRAFVAVAGWSPVGGNGESPALLFVTAVTRGHRHDRRKEKLMTAQTGYLQPDAIGVFPTVLLLLVLILAMLGVVAHAAFV